MAGVTIRPLALDEAEPVCALIHRAFAAQKIATDPPSSAFRETPATIADALAAGGGLGAEEAARLVGVVLWEEKDGGLYLGRLAVDPAVRRRGVARELIAAVEAEAVRCSLPRLHLSVRLSLLDNRRLFASCGFVETIRSAHPGYREPTSVAMEKRLSLFYTAGKSSEKVTLK
jgi:ribosomal protein S18 acetylase RimI-like enzyme